MSDNTKRSGAQREAEARPGGVAGVPERSEAERGPVEGCAVEVKDVRLEARRLALLMSAPGAVETGAHLLAGIDALEADRERALRECARLREEVSTHLRLGELYEGLATKADVAAAEASERAYNEAKAADSLKALHLVNAQRIRCLRAERRESLVRLMVLRARVCRLERMLKREREAA